MLPVSGTDRLWDYRHRAKQQGWGGEPAQIPLILPILAPFLPCCQNPFNSAHFCPLPFPAARVLNALG